MSCTTRNDFYPSINIVLYNTSYQTHLMLSLENELEALQFTGLGRFSGPWKKWSAFPQHGSITGISRVMAKHLQYASLQVVVPKG